jgi:hypothetical protein
MPGNERRAIGSQVGRWRASFHLVDRQNSVFVAILGRAKACELRVVADTHNNRIPVETMLIKRLATLCGMVLAASLAAFALPAAAQQKKPNIIMIFSDDVGP